MPTLLEWGLSNAVTVVVLAPVVALVTHVVRRPALAHGLWLLVLLKLLMPPVVPVPLAWPASTPGHETAGAQDVASSPTLPAVDLSVNDDLPLAESVETPAPDAPLWQAENWLLVLLGLWAAGSLVWFGVTLVQVGQFERLLRYAQRAPEELQAEAQRIAGQLGLRRCPPVWLVPGAVSPMVWAAGRAPRVLFPGRLLGALNEEQRATLLVHELAHVRRGDPWVRLVEWLVLGLYWWHPVAWWARRELREAEEQCCDAWVVWACEGAGRTYALALVQTVAFFSQARSPLPVAASGIGPVPRLRRRLTMIMRAKTPKSLSWAGWLGVFSLALVLLPLAPVQGQQPEPGARSEGAKMRALRLWVQQLAQAPEVELVLRDAPTDEAEAARAQEVTESLKALKMEIEKKRRELEILEKKLAAASKSFAKLQGDKAARLAEVAFAAGDPKAKKASAEMLAKALEQYLKAYPDLKAYPAPEGSSADALLKAVKQSMQAKPATTEAKPADLEKKLDRILKEVDELRHELRRAKAADPAGPAK
jgi:beta-lactamase regulating signal transducer with metallopeptidase domain